MLKGFWIRSKGMSLDFKKLLILGSATRGVFELSGIMTLFLMIFAVNSEGKSTLNQLFDNCMKDVNLFFGATYFIATIFIVFLFGYLINESLNGKM